MQETKEQILARMDENMPFSYSEKIRPYILEAMQIHADQQLILSGVSKRYYHEVCGKGTLIKEYEHSVYGTMLMVKPLNKKDIYFAPKLEFTELPFS